MNASKIVAYRRTSTDDQKLGIEAQDATIHRIARDMGCEVTKTFTEHESGGDCEREELAKAISYARRVRAALVVAKLDRLARDTGFLLKLVDSGVKIVFGDLPGIDLNAAGRLQVEIMGAFATFERRLIGERTREALAALKAQGVKLGTPANLHDCHRRKGREISAQRRRQKAVEEMADVFAVASPMRCRGCTLAAIAKHLNENEYLTRNGSQWSPGLVKRVLDRAI